MAWIEKRTRKNGLKWYVCWHVTLPDGTTKQKSKMFSIKAQAEEYERLLDSATYRGLVIDPSAGCQLFGVYAENWLKTRIKASGQRLRLSTITTYRKHLRLYLLPTFEYDELRHITVARVKAWYDASCKRSEAQTKKAYKLLHAVMTTAHYEFGLEVPHLPGYGAEYQRKRILLSDDEVLEFAERVKDRHRAIIYAIAFGALRPPGEVRGLRRMDVHRDDLTLDILRNVQQIPKALIEEFTGEEVKTSAVVGDPKTAAGIRTISVTGFVMEEIVEHMAKFTGPLPTSYVFSGARGGLLGLKGFYADFNKVREDMGLDSSITPYNLRHWSLTTAAKTPGMTTKNLMARGGHSSFEAALKYQHEAEEVDRAASDFMGQRLAAKRRTLRAEEAKVVSITERAS